MDNDNYLDLMGMKIGDIVSPITITCNWRDTLKVGDIITTTTSEFSFNNIRGCFSNAVDYRCNVTGVLINVDASSFVKGKDSYGGCYGFNFYTVISIDQLEIGYER
jgi:hypothetical protein